MAGGLFGGKKTRQEQLDEQEKKAGAIAPEPDEMHPEEDVMYADGAFGMRKKHKAKKRGGGDDYPW